MKTVSTEKPDNSQN